jgi:hypothetical protein
MILGICLITFGILMLFLLKSMVNKRTGVELSVFKMFIAIMWIPVVLFGLIVGPLMVGSFMSSFKEKYWDNK